MWWGAPEHWGAPAPLVKLSSLLAVLQGWLRYPSCELSPSRRRGEDRDVAAAWLVLKALTPRDLHLH